jgi:hypothetical protein
MYRINRVILNRGTELMDRDPEQGCRINGQSS